MWTIVDVRGRKNGRVPESRTRCCSVLHRSKIWKTNIKLLLLILLLLHDRYRCADTINNYDRMLQTTVLMWFHFCIFSDGGS
jgi:hypothetical protein